MKFSLLLVFVLLMTAAVSATQYIAPSNGANQSIGTNNLLFFDNTNGRIGLGTITPATLLDVNGGRLRINASAAVLELTSNSSNKTNYIFTDATSGDLYIRTDSGAHDVIIQAKPGTATANVGVNTTAPNMTLDVSGTGRFTDTLTLSNGVVITGTATIGGNAVWHAGNDGSGSGLDADTIDGNNYNANWPTTLANVQSALSNDFHNVGGTDDDTPDNDAEVPDAHTISGGTIGSNSISGTLTTTGTLTIGDDGDAIVVSATNWDVPSTGNAVFAGNLTLSPAASKRLFMGGTASGDFGIAYDASNPNYGLFYKEGTPDKIVISPDGGGATGTLFVVNGDGTITASGNTVWHAGNDGSGSGLDADTVDGNNYNSNWPTTLANIQSATSSDFHNIGGTDDDTPDNDGEVPDAITVSAGTLGSNTISSGATFTTAGTWTLGDNGDAVVISATNWDIDSNGNLSIPSTARIYLDGGGNTYITEHSADEIRMYTGGTAALILTSSQSAVLQATKRLYLDGGGNTYILEESGDAVEIVAGGVRALRVTSTYVEAGPAGSNVDFMVGAGKKIYFDGGGDSYMYLETTGPDQLRLYVNGAGNTQWGNGWIDLENSVYASGLPTTANGANLYVDSSDQNHFYRSTSSIRYKHDVRTMGDENATALLNGLRPVFFKSLASADDPDELFAGFIAEEVAMAPGGTMYVQFNGNNTPEGVAYAQLTSPLVAGWQVHERDIEELDQRLSVIESSKASQGSAQSVESGGVAKEGKDVIIQLG